MSSTEPLNTTSSGSCSKNVVDLEDIVLKWARDIFQVTKTKCEARLRKKHLQYNINWSHLFNESLEPKYIEVAKHIQDGGNNKSKEQPKIETVLFKSSYTNTTGRDQEYSFKAGRSTRSIATVSVEKGVCRGIEMSLKLKTPCEIVEANGGFHSEMSVLHIGENTIEEELEWGVDSNVRIPPRCKAIAELVILEDYQKRKFTIESRLSGKIIVTITNLNDNNSLVTILEGKIADIIRSLPNREQLGFKVEHDNVSYETTGTCTFRYGIEQKVKITEHPLNNGT